MNQRDQQALDAVQAALGFQPYGSPGFSPDFGRLPFMQTLPPGHTQFQGGTFFGFQQPPPYHMNIPGMPYGQAVGMGVERFAQSRGYDYYPRGVNAMDTLRGRDFEQQMMQVQQMTSGFDETKLARAIADAFRIMGKTGPDALAQASSLAALIPTGMLPAFTRYTPGGSATDFATQFFMASQDLRDTTRNSFALGMPAQNSSDMSRRLLDFFMPTGQFDGSRTSGMNLGDLGGLSRELSSMGLLNTSVPRSSVDSLAKTLGVNSKDLSTEDIGDLRDIAKPQVIGRQLQAYAEVIGTMREIMGRPDAPIPSIIRDLQQITGGAMQEMNPSDVNNLLFRVRETARASNISMTAMMEAVKQGSTMFQQMGLSGLTGANVAMQAASATVASQTVTPGAFFGRPSPGRELNLRQEFLTRATTSSAMQTSVQTLRMLSEIDRSKLTAGQQKSFDELSSRANSLEFSQSNVDEARTLLNDVGVGYARSAQRLSSSVGVQRFIGEHPDIIGKAFGGQMRETISDIQGTARGYYQFLSSRGTNDELVQQINNAAAGSVRTPEQVMDLVAQSYEHAPRGTIQERASWLRSQGIDGINFESLFNSFEADDQMQYQLRGRGIKNGNELAYMASQASRQAIRDQQSNVDIAVQGQHFLSKFNIRTRGGVMERIFGAVADGSTGGGVAQILESAFGFVPSEEVEASFRESGLSAMAETARLLRDEKDPNKQKVLKAKLDQQRKAVEEVADRFPGLTRKTAGDIRKMIDTIGPKVQRSAVNAANVDLSDNERIEALRSVVEQLGNGAFTEDQIGVATLSMDPRTARKFRGDVARMQADLSTGTSLFDDLADADTYEDADIARSKLLKLGERLDLYSPYRDLRKGENAELSRGAAYKRTTTIRKFNRIQELMDKFSGAKGEKEARNALADLQGAFGSAENQLLEIDPETGIARINKKFVREMVDLDERYIGDPEGRKKYEEQLTGTLNNIVDLGVKVNDKGEADLTPEELDKLQTDIRERENKDVRLGSDQLINDKPFPDDEMAFIQGGPEADDLLKRVGTDKAARLQSLRRARADVKKINALLKTDFEGEDKAVVKRTLESLQGLIETSDIYDEDGRVTTDAARVLFATQGQAQGSATISVLEKLQDIKGLTGDDLKKALEEIQEKSKADQKAAKSDESGDDKKVNSFTIKIIDEDTGEELKTINVGISVPNAGSARGREASETVVPNVYFGGQPVTTSGVG